MALNTIAENLDFAYIHVGYLDGTFVEEGTEDYFSAYKTDANIKTFVDKKFFNQVNPNDSYFGMSNWGSYYLSNAIPIPTGCDKVSTHNINAIQFL